MHTLLAVTFQEVGRGLLAVVVFGAALLAGLAVLTLLCSIAHSWRTRRGMKQRARNAAPEAAIALRALRANPVSSRRGEPRSVSKDAGRAAGLRARLPLEEIG